MTLGTRLKQVRRRHGLTAVRLARLSGIHQTQYLSLESPRVKDISVSLLVRLARALRVSPGDLAAELVSSGK
jgi:transcriptional regulator with XRE-family HTH domain